MVQAAGSNSSIQTALQYSEAHGATSRFPLIVTSEQEAAPYVIAGEPVASMGGFTGRETVLTHAFPAKLIRSGEARYFLLGGGGGFGGGPGGGSNAAIGPSSRPARRCLRSRACTTARARPMRSSAPDELRRVLLFATVGVVNTLLSLAVYTALLSLHTGYLVAAPVAFAAGALNGYLLNARFTLPPTLAPFARPLRPGAGGGGDRRRRPALGARRGNPQGARGVRGDARACRHGQLPRQQNLGFR